MVTNRRHPPIHGSTQDELFGYHSDATRLIQRLLSPHPNERPSAHRVLHDRWAAPFQRRSVWCWGHQSFYLRKLVSDTGASYFDGPCPDRKCPCSAPNLSNCLPYKLAGKGLSRCLRRACPECRAQGRGGVWTLCGNRECLAAYRKNNARGRTNERS